MKLERVYSPRRRVDQLEIVIQEFRPISGFTMEPVLLVCRVRESAACSLV